MGITTYLELIYVAQSHIILLYKNTLQIAYSSESPQCISSVMLLYEHRQHIDVHSQILMIFGMGCVYNDKKDSLQDVTLHNNVRQ